MVRYLTAKEDSFCQASFVFRYHQSSSKTRTTFYSFCWKRSSAEALMTTTTIGHRCITIMITATIICHHDLLMYDHVFVIVYHDVFVIVYLSSIIFFASIIRMIIYVIYVSIYLSIYLSIYPSILVIISHHQPHHRRPIRLPGRRQ